MSDFDFDELGDRISDLIEEAVNSKNYQQLNEAITDVVNSAIDSGTDILKTVIKGATDSANAYKKYRYKAPKEFAEEKAKKKAAAVVREPNEELYGDTSGAQIGGIFAAIGGGILTGANALALMMNGALSFLRSAGGNAGMLITAFFMAVGVGLIVWSSKILKKVGRFKRYKKALGEHTYIDLNELTRVSDKPIKFVRKDVKSMIGKGWFKEGHLDAEENTLMTNTETYNQYIETQKELQAKKIREARERAKEPVITPEVQDILDKGNEYLEEIRACNERIPGEEMSAKIKEIEDIVSEILARAKEHPEITADLKKLMNYYLPMTIKLLNAYEEMDRQPVQGENIRKSKKEIEDTLTTLHAAFVKLLDSVFAETALDVSTDITVLNTLLAQEGLKEDELQVAMRH